ncbi:MAG: DnaD domain protein, partial [Mycoplasmoidaceae bacterium]|nr:DnaD domain protein [Mycoplasmoidaceae bacterium]
MKAHEYVISAKNVNVFSSIKLHRNAAMFIKNLSDKEMLDIFNEYKNLNSEQYLAAIYKAPLSVEEKDVINSLRKTYKLPDYIINLLVDFTIFKTKGKLNSTYIYKVAKTINGLNLNTLDEIYSYFRFNNTVINK